MASLIGLQSKLDLLLIRMRIVLADSASVNGSKGVLSRLRGLVRKAFAGKALSPASEYRKSQVSTVETGVDTGDKAYVTFAAGTQPKAQSNGPDLPIVLIHAKNPDYLQYSLRCTRISNPGARICLLGDESNSRFDFLEHYSFSPYSERANRFARFFTNYSTNGRDFELFCFQRWFILNEFLAEQGIEKCLYLDSDVMLFADAAAEQKKFAEFDFALATNIMACVLFLNNSRILGEFCGFLEDIYTKKDRYHYDKMVAHYAVRQRNGLKGGACDMTAFELFNLDYLAFVGNVVQIIDDSIYDPAMTTAFPGFETEQQVKRIFWRENHPYGRHLKSNRYIRFNSMHFQGRSKSLMKQVYDRVCSNA